MTSRERDAAQASDVVTGRIQVEGVPISLRTLLTSALPAAQEIRQITVPEPDRDFTWDRNTIRQLCGGDRIVIGQRQLVERDSSVGR